MIVRCPDCLTKYEIAAARIPEEGIRVRCPKCKAVFPVSRLAVEEREAVPAGATEAAPARPAEAARAAAEPRDGAAVATAAMDGEPPRPRAAHRITDPAVARRLARAILQEMLFSRGPEHRSALADGTVLSRFGGAIFTCRGIYAEKVAPELPGAETIFLDAVRDVVGGGKPLF